jgi:hypothetical protein
MFQLSLILAVLMILTALIPFSMRLRWLCLVPCLVWILIWGFAVLLFTNVLFAPAIGWLYLFLIIAFPLVRLMRLNWIWFQAICLCCALTAYGISIFEFIPAYHEHQELLAQYPAVDLKGRLAYEHLNLNAIESAAGGLNIISRVDESPKYDADVLRQLADAYRSYLDISIYRIEYRRNDRRLGLQALMRVHQGFVADFIAQPGVGRSRLPGLKLLRKSNFMDEVDGVRLDDPSELIEQPDLQQQSSDFIGTASSAVQAESNDASQSDSMIPNSSLQIPADVILQSLHLHNITNFVPLNSLGGVNDQLQARGFEAHAFRLAPTRSSWENGPGEWRLARLELVSLLKHHPPAVYVSAHLPAMDELRNAPTRAVTSFELDAIAKLAKGEELIVEPSGGQELSMLGSIRAISDCRECHQVPLGGLLGAFSYKLRAVSATPRRSEALPDKRVQ